MPSFSANPLSFLQIFPTAAFLFFFRTDYMDSPDCLLLLLSISVADAGFLQGGCGSWCLWNAPIPFMPSLPPTLKKISWEPPAR